MNEHEQSTVDWKAEVERYAAQGERQAQLVAEAQENVGLPRTSSEYWEAVYTLVRQRAQMTAEPRREPS